MIDREREERVAREALAAKLRATSPLFGATAGAPAPLQSVSQPTREVQPVATPSAPGISSVMAEVDDARVARAEEERRAADPIAVQEDRLSRLASSLTSDEILMLQEAIHLARTDGSADYLREVVEYLDQTEEQEL